MNIRWMIRRDMPEILVIERASFKYPWSEKDFVDCLRARYVIGHVIARDDEGPILGYVIHEMGKTQQLLLNLAVLPDARREGVGRALIEHMKKRLTPQRRRGIRMRIRQDNLAAHLFLKACGFRCESSGIYGPTDEDYYQFRYIKDSSDAKAGVAAAGAAGAGPTT